MIQLLWRFAKRFAVLVPGLVIAYFAVRNVFPYFDRRLPQAIAVLVTYILVAYVVLPAVIRLWRIIIPAKHLPLYCVTPDGFASDPLNIGLIGTRLEIIKAMEKAGWYQADPHTLRNALREGLSTVYGWSYPQAPVSSLYLFGRKQDLAFEIPIAGGGPGSRHHVRFWATTYDVKKPLDFHTIHWHHRREHVVSDKLLWVGAASLDVGIGYIRHNFQITHMIDPDTNKERQLIIDGLKSQKLVQRTKSIKLGEPYRVINRVIRGHLHTDGKMEIITLRTAGLSAGQKAGNNKPRRPAKSAAKPKAAARPAHRSTS